MALDPATVAGLGRDGIAPRDGEHPLHRRSIGRVTVGQPAPHRPPSKRRRRLAQGARVGRIEIERELIEQLRVVAQQVCLPRDQRRDIALGDVSRARA